MAKLTDVDITAGPAPGTAYQPIIYRGLDVVGHYVKNLPFSHTEMIAARLRWPRDKTLPFDFIQTHQISHDRVVVFIVQGDQVITLEDDALFPSDKFITQLRLIMKE